MTKPPASEQRCEAIGSGSHPCALAPGHDGFHRCAKKWCCQWIPFTVTGNLPTPAPPEQPACQRREALPGDEDEATGAMCGKPAEWAHCVLLVPVCTEHRCRCHKPLAKRPEQPARGDGVRLTDEERAVIAKAIRWNETHNAEDEGEKALEEAVEKLLKTITVKGWLAKLKQYELDDTPGKDER